MGNGIRRKRADGITETVHHLVERIKDFVTEPAFTKFLPDLFHRIHFRRIGGRKNRRMLSGTESKSDLGQAAPSQQRRMTSSGNWFDKWLRKRFIQTVLLEGRTKKQFSPVAGSTAP